MSKKVIMLLLLSILFLHGCINLGGEKEKKETYNIDLNECVGCGGNEETDIANQTINQTQTNQTEENKTADNLIQENQTQQNLENESKVNETIEKPKEKPQEKPVQEGDTQSKEEKNRTEEKVEESTTLEQPKENTSEVETVCIGPTFENISLTERSSLKYKNTIYNDECVSWNTVKKYYCKNESVMSGNFNCEPGYWCQNGACVEYEGSCVDSDGNDTKTYGYVSYTPSVFSTATEYDKCVDEATIEEWICEGSKPIKQTLECGSGFKCSEGKCIKSKCKEGDGGINPLVPSYISNEEESANDACVDDYTLREYYCYADDVRYVDIKCKDKCYDDSCMPKDES